MPDAANPYEEAFELCKLQASVDGAFPDALLRFWFQSAWDLCASMIGFVYPAREVQEPICPDECGNFTISYQPSSVVQIFSGYSLVATFPPNLRRTRCDPALCCYCNLVAKYTVGEETCELPPRFLQAVARLFTYICENRGDTELDEAVLGKCGAKLFLSPDLTYVA